MICRKWILPGPRRSFCSCWKKRRANSESNEKKNFVKFKRICKNHLKHWMRAPKITKNGTKIEGDMDYKAMKKIVKELESWAEVQDFVREYNEMRFRELVLSLYEASCRSDVYLCLY